ncbi:hypothetical protein LCGC14_1592040 [marine sediment metagenome]|uniref:Phage terminase large subunit N-terminal domain-containing protein n=1 Tax=marine sediment metagenome TaxID=412755 RepID=A0A0F9IDK1_9ZZZZ
MANNDHEIDVIGRGPTIAQQLAFADSLGVEVTPEQGRALESRARLKLVAGGERGGKSLYSALEVGSRLLWGTLFWIIAIDYEQARPEFEYLLEWLGGLGAIANYRKDVSFPKYGRCSLVTKTGQRIETRSADDVKKIAGRAPSGIVLAEAAQMGYDVYLKALGRLTETRGWLLASGTFEGSSGWYAEKFNEWQGLNTEGGKSFSIPTWSNHFVYPGGRQDPEILRLERLYSKVPGMFEERCGAVPVPPVGLVFRQFRDTVHIDTRATFNEDKPVYLCVDPSGGTNPYAVGVVQFYTAGDVGFEYDEAPVDAIDFCYMVDRIYERGKIDEEIIDMAMRRKWWSRVAGGAIDVEAPDSKKRWSKYGGVTLWSRKVLQIEGIRRMQTFLYNSYEDGKYTWPPHLLVHPNVEEFSYEARNYRRAKKVGASKQGIEYEFKEVPPSDQPNHLLKALWYLLIARYGYVKSAQKARIAYTWKNPARKRSQSKTKTSGLTSVSSRSPSRRIRRTQTRSSRQ